MCMRCDCVALDDLAEWPQVGDLKAGPLMNGKVLGKLGLPGCRAVELDSAGTDDLVRPSL